MVIELELLISVIGALGAIAVSLISSILSRRNLVSLESHQMKEDHYASYINSLSLLSMDNRNNVYLKEYSDNRNRILMVASTEVINVLLKYEEEAFGKFAPHHDELLSALIMAMRKDLQLDNNGYPVVGLVKP